MGQPDVTPQPPVLGNRRIAFGAALASMVLAGSLLLWPRQGADLSSRPLLALCLAILLVAAIATAVLVSRLKRSIATPLHARIAELEGRIETLAKERRLLEETLVGRTQEVNVAKETIEAAGRARSGFIASMSHEIRTTLNGIMVMAELLAAANLDRRQQRYAEVIVNSGRSLLSIINDILDLSRIEAGKLSIETAQVDPLSIADDVISLFWVEAVSKGLDLAIRTSAKVPALIEADPVRLNQILSNLVNNALKFTEKGQVLVSLIYDRGWLSITVTDSGLGIRQSKLDTLFSAPRKFGGSGLGLAFCNRLAEAMGGAISVSSELGKGSSFTIRLPAKAVKAPPKFAAPLAGMNRAGLTVEGRASLSALGTTLAAAGYTVSEAAPQAFSADVLFVSASQLDKFRFPDGQDPKIICLAGMGDSRGDTALASGAADHLLPMPLRQADIRAVLDCLAAGKLRSPAASLAPERSADFSGRHILVADDNAVNREVIIEVLRQMSITVETAANGIEAVQCWKRRKPDLVFMDCSMPRMDGLAATREIRAHEKLSLSDLRTPVVALTANVVGGTAEDWRSAGMDAYLTKPFTVRTIVSCLGRFFQGVPALETGAELAVSGHDILDAAVIDELRRIGGNDLLFRRVLELFASRVPPAMDRVRNLRRSPDLTALADATHALKSMCANIGARRAIAICDELETLARTGVDFDAGRMIAQISHEMNVVLREIDRLRAA